MKEILFPYKEIREEQDKFIKDIKNVLEKKKNLLAHAPTGLGKTVSVLGPCLKYAIENDKVIYFLTSRHTQHKIVLETLEEIKEKYNLNFKIGDFIGKKWMCLQSGILQLNNNEFSEYCSSIIAKGNCEFYENLKFKGKLTGNAKKALQVKKFDVENVKEVCRENKVCPYEIMAMIAKDSRIIIGDYYHILNPSIRDNLFKKTERNLSDIIIIFDEAHNLASRARELLSCNMSTFILDNAVKEARNLGYNEMGDDIGAIKKVLEKLINKVKFEELEGLIEREEFIEGIKEMGDYDEIIGNCKFIAEQILEMQGRSFNLSVANFLSSWLGPDEGFTRIIKKEFVRDKAILNLMYKCLDPSILIKDLDDAIIIGMSGTLNPLEMYDDVYGLDAVLKEYEDPFPKENRLNLIIPETTTKFTFRNSDMFKRIAEICSNVVNKIPGNTVVFFPSYEVRNEVLNYFNGNKTMFIEEKGLSNKEKEDLINKFKSYSNNGAVLLAVSSGSLGEGIDLPGEFLKGVVVVGLPLSKPDLETKELIRYYEERYRRGWDYGYIYPAFLKTLQNAGRCIRSSSDRGVIVFLDERYIWDNYFRCFPKDWKIIISKLYEERIEKFFS